MVSSFQIRPPRSLRGHSWQSCLWLSVLGIAHEVSDGCSVLQAAVHRVHHHSRHIPLVRMASWSHDCPGFPVRQGEYTGSRPRPLHILLPTNLCLFICSHDCASLVFWLECKFCVCLGFLGFFFVLFQCTVFKLHLYRKNVAPTKILQRIMIKDCKLHPPNWTSCYKQVYHQHTACKLSSKTNHMTMWVCFWRKIIF